MDRFSQQTPAGNYARNRFAQEIAESAYHPDGYTCQNCGEVVSRVTPVPEFDYLACDDCMEEAMAVLSREAVAIAEMLGETTVTREEGEAFLTWIDRKPVVVERMQMSLFPEVA